MDSEGTRPASQPDLVNPRPPPPNPDGLRRCFICLTDEEPTDSPEEWVNPCPCTLEAHQDCMLSWVTDCERSNKPLLCPVCKSRIQLEGPWDPIVALTETISRKFTRASPFVLASSVTLGVQFSLQMYGALALWTFAGRDAFLSYLVGESVMINGETAVEVLPVKQRLGNALVLTNVAPVLLIGKLMPWLGNKMFLPSACFYGVYHVMHDDNFFSWPPSPQLAMAAFPYIRSAYFNLWKEFVSPHEMNLNRRIMGLPPLEEQQRENQENNPRNGNQEGEGGVLGFLQGIIDALGPDDDNDPIAEPGQGLRFEAGGDGEEGGMVLELVIEEVREGDDDSDSDDEEGLPELVELDERDRNRPVELPQHRAEGQPGIQLADRQEDQPVQQRANEPAVQPAQQPADQPPINRPVIPEQPAQNQPVQGHNHEVPQAPPARRGLGSILSSVSNSIVSALILPGVSFAMGELLRLALPKAWTTSGLYRRPGLLHQQWGRSLVGGCLYVVLKDAVRVYTKYRKVAAMENRKVKNVDRRRNRR